MLCRLTNEGLPPTLTQLKYLKAIGLKRNCLTSVPRMLGAMTSLQEIYLEDNAKLQVTLLAARPVLIVLEELHPEAELPAARQADMHHIAWAIQLPCRTCLLPWL